MTVAIILAGGLGKRLRSCVSDLPKPMAPIEGRPFLEYQMDYWIGQGIERFVLSVGYKHEVIVEHFGTRYRGVPVDYVIERTPLGTGGGLLLAAKELIGSEPFLVLNGDTFFEVELEALTNFHNERASDWTFALFRANQADRYMGVVMGDDGKVFSMKSGTREIGRLANGGIYFVNPDILKSSMLDSVVKVSLEDELLESMIASGRALYGFESLGRFIDIGVPHDYARAAKVLAE